MAYFALLWKARIIEKYRLNYEKQKLNSIRLMNAHNPQKPTRSLYQKLCHYNRNTKKRISKTFLRFYPEGSPVYNFFYYWKTDQTLPNFVLKSVIGFVGGIILTYLCFMFFMFQLSISLIPATIMSSIIGVLLTLGLAFSYRIRCLVFLLIPQFFSRIGRYTLTCYALVLILTGPATNTLKNSEVLSESLACAEEQVKTNMYLINESVKKPYNSMKDSIGLMVNGVKKLAAKIKKMTMRLHRLTLSIAHSLQSSFTWLNTVADECNKHFGTPYDSCVRAVKRSIAECQASLGPWYSWICDTGRLIEAVCWPMLPFASFCHVLDFTNGNILGVVTKKLNAFTERVNSMLYLDVHVHHSYSFSGNSSKSASLVAAGIVTEIRNKADLLLTWLSWSSCVTSLSLLLIISRAKYYQHMYETRSRFDNRYVTKELIDLDLKRLRQGKETVLPLNRREEGKYIKTSSFRLGSSEKMHLSRSAVAMAITTFKLMIHIVADYSLYWVLMTIRHHGLSQTPLNPGSSYVSAYVSGSTLISKILMSLVGTMTVPLATPPPSTLTCLPDPHPPDFQRYLQIGILIFLLWFFALFEPYGLRLRHIIMGLYRPERAKARAVWLFNHIQRTRGSFIKFARRKLHREYKYFSENRFTFRNWLWNNIPCVGLKNFFGLYSDEAHCFLCGILEDCNECDGSLVMCDTPGCPGTYCTKCFSDIGQLCTICLSPSDYGDLSDVSLEKGSSEESGDDEPKPPQNSNGRHASYQKCPEDDNEASTSKNERRQKQSRTFFSLNNNVKNEDSFPLLKPKDEDEDNKYNKRKVSKAMLVRHKKYTDFDLRDGRRKSLLMSLGHDTECAICHEHCEVCAINIPTNNITDAKLLNCNYCDAYDKTIVTKSSSSKFKKAKDKQSIQSKHNSSIEESIEKFKRCFKGMRKYALHRRYSYPVIKTKSNRCCFRSKLNYDLHRRYFYPAIKTKSNRLYLIKIPNSLKVRRGSRKRKKRLKIPPKTSFCTHRSKNISKLSILPLKISANTERARQHRIEKKQRAEKKSGFGLKIIKLIYRHGSSKNSHFVQCVNQNSDNYSQFKVSGKILDASTNFVMKCNDTLPGPSKDPPDKENLENDRPSDTKDDRMEGNTTKFIERQKSSLRIWKFYGFCANYWKNGSLFPPQVKTVLYCNNNDVPVLFNKKNHKKRKKIDSTEEISEPHKLKQDKEATRKYRISTYLSEQDWMKKRCKQSKPDFHADHKNGVLRDLLEAETESTKILFKRTLLEDKIDAARGKGDNNNIIIHTPEISTENDKTRTRGQIGKKIKKKSPVKRDTNKKKHIPEVNDQKDQKLPKELLKKSKDKNEDLKSEDLKTDVDLKCGLKKIREKIYPLTLKNDKKAKKMKVVTQSPKNDLVEKLSDIASYAETVGDQNNTASQSRECDGMTLSRSLEYYRSLGNRDFDPYVELEKQQASIEANMIRTGEKEVEARTLVRDAKAQTQEEKNSESRTENPAFIMTTDNCSSKPGVFGKLSGKSCKKQKSTKKEEKSESEKINNPFHRIMRCFYMNRTKKTNNPASSKSLDKEATKVDAEVAAIPHVQHIYCQYGETVPLHDQTTQILDLKEAAQSMSLHRDMFKEVGVDAIAKMRTEATQYTQSLRQVATYFQSKRPTKLKTSHTDATTLHFNALKRQQDKNTLIHQYAHCEAQSPNETSSSLSVLQSLPSMEGTKIEMDTSDDYKSETDVLDSTSDTKIDSEDNVTETESNIKNNCFKTDSEDTKTTDATVYTFSTVGYDETPSLPRRRKTKKLRLSVVTKSNMATCTERTKFCDVSTVTSDWWSPILERKNKTVTIFKKGVQGVQAGVPAMKKKELKDRAVGTAGRIVTFNSNAQIIPSTHLDLMSPSRYLLESQRYYNELFSNKYYTSIPLSSTTNERYATERTSSYSRRHVLKKKNYKSKRSDESYSTKNQLSPYMEQVWMAESKHQKLPTTAAYQKRPRVNVVKNNGLLSARGVQTKGVKKSKHPNRKHLRKPELKIKKGEVNLLTRRYVSNDNISLDCPTISMPDTGSF